jgi:hypothetical protein
VDGDINNANALTNGFKQDKVTRPYAPRLQYPILITYNKAYADPVTLDTTAIQVGKDANGTVIKVTEYMNSVATADKANFGGAAASFPNVYIPYAEVTNPTFLANARAEQEFNASQPYVDTRNPNDGHTVIVDEKLSANIFDGITGKIGVDTGGVEYVDIFENFFGQYAQINVSNSVDAAKAFLAVLLNGQEFNAFDISAFDDSGNKLTTQSGAKITITLPIPDSLADKASSIQIGHIKADGSLEILASTLTLKEGRWYITFATSSLSPFAFIIPQQTGGQTPAPTIIENTSAVTTASKAVKKVAGGILVGADIDEAADAQTLLDDDIPLAAGINNDVKTKADTGASDTQEEGGGFPVPIAIAVLAVAILAFGAIGLKTGFIKLGAKR